MVQHLARSGPAPRPTGNCASANTANQMAEIWPELRRVEVQFECSAPPRDDGEEGPKELAEQIGDEEDGEGEHGRDPAGEASRGGLARGAHHSRPAAHAKSKQRLAELLFAIRVLHRRDLGILRLAGRHRGRALKRSR